MAKMYDVGHKLEEICPIHNKIKEYMPGIIFDDFLNELPNEPIKYCESCVFEPFNI